MVTYSYDSYGNVLSSARTSGQYSLKQTNSYTANGDFLKSTQSENKITTHYNYNPDNGLLDSTSNAKGAVTNYSYDAIGLLKQVSLQNDDHLLSNNYIYENNRLSSIARNGFSYNFAYNSKGSLTGTKVNNNLLASYDYDEYSNIRQIDFANGQSVFYRYDKDKITGIDLDHDGTMEYTYTYNKDGLDTAYDYVNNTKTVVQKAGNAVTSTMDGKRTLYASVYNETTKEMTEVVNGQTLQYQTDKSQTNGIITSSVTAKNDALQLSAVNTSDGFKRLAEKKVSVVGSGTGLKTSYSYSNYNDNQTTSSAVSSIKNELVTPQGSTFKSMFQYLYDTVGNITLEAGTSGNSMYQYDAANQLVSESNNVNGKTTYAYDAGGNLTQKVADGEVIDYTYDAQWKDLLTGYGGQAITHDGLGNVLNDGNWDYTWESGRQLNAMQSDVNGNLSFRYNTEGLRTQKVVNNEQGNFTYDYIWANGVLVGMQVTNHGDSSVTTLRFLYENGKAFGFLVDEATPYFYIKNLHGDVVQIVDESGNTMVTYSYDSWGNELSATGDETLLALNPFTYRGYQYDRETGLYYLQARYYNPQWGRFINADTNMDTQTSVIGTNIFAYCDNNPVMHTDTRGKGIDLSTLTEEQGTHLFVNLLQMLTEISKNGKVIFVDIDVYSMTITKAMAAILQAAVGAAITTLALVAIGALIKVSALVASILTPIQSVFLAGSAGVFLEEFITNMIEISTQDFWKKFNIFSNVTPGEYLYGFVMITDVVDDGFYSTQYSNKYRFIFGPFGTSLDFFYNTRTEVSSIRV